MLGSGPGTPGTLACAPFPPGSTGTDQQKCAFGNTLHDGYTYVYNAHRGTASAACGESAHCFCCRCPSGGPCTRPLPPPHVDVVGDATAAVLSSDGASLHNLGGISGPSSGHHTAFNASQVTTFGISANGSIVAQVRNRTVTFDGLPSPGATCGTPGHRTFGCPFRTSGRGYVRLADGTLVMSIIVYLDGAHANPAPRLKESSTSIVAYRSTDDGFNWRYAGLAWYPPTVY